LRIRVAFLGETPIASIVTLSFNKSVTYKYGASDSTYHRLHAPTILIHGAIQDARAEGAAIFDMGRSDTDNSGLISFKDSWGADKSILRYYRAPSDAKAALLSGVAAHMAGCLFNRVPDFAFAALGRILYRHIG